MKKLHPILGILLHLLVVAGIFLIIRSIVAEVGAVGLARFLWFVVWDNDILTGIALILIPLFILQCFVMKLPGYMISLVSVVGKE